MSVLLNAMSLKEVKELRNGVSEIRGDDGCLYDLYLYFDKYITPQKWIVGVAKCEFEDLDYWKVVTSSSFESYETAYEFIRACEEDLETGLELLFNRNYYI